MVTIKIDDRKLRVPEGNTILQAAEDAGIPIPHLCYLKELNEIAACRMCMVEVEDTERLVPACNTQVVDGMSSAPTAPGCGRPARPTFA